MPFIGNQPALSYTSFAKQDFTTSATTSYTLNNPVANENEIALFINFVRQEPTTAYTASGTTLTLTSATSASDDMYCVFLGKAVQTVNPPNNSVSNAMLSETITVANGGTGLTSGFKNGITEVDQWRLTADLTADANPISADLERNDSTGFGKIGTGMSVSSGIWTFPSTGLWKIEAFFTGIIASGDAQIIGYIRTYINSSPTDVTQAFIGSSGDYDSAMTSFLYNVTNTSTHQLTFRVSSIASGGVIRGNTGANETHFNFIRLGDSV